MQSNKQKSLVPATSVPTLVSRMIRRITREGHLSGFTDEEVLAVLREAKQSLEPQPAMLEIDAPILIFGDIHGQLRDLLRFFTIVGPPPHNKILFLGDYVDRCKKSFEVIMLLLCYRIKYPNMTYLLRGNHECSKMNRLYGFYEEMRRKRSVRMWKKFQEVFNELPLCAVVSSRLLCMHGGISPQIQSWDALVNLQKPKTPRACDEGIAVDLMWSDPSMDSCTGFQFNATRATSYIFGGDTIANICSMLDISMVVRAHEVVKDGHQFLFDKKLVTIFSAPNYCGTDGNAGSVMKVSGDLEISFITLKPRLDANRLSEEKRLLIEKMLADSMAKSPDPYSRLLTSKKATRNKGANFDDSNLIGPPPVPGKVAATVDMDLNERDNEKPSSPSQPPSLSPYPDPPQEKQEFINGVQADKKDTSFNNTLDVLPPEKSDTTPSPWYPKSTGISPSPANIQAADSATSKPDMVKNSVSDAENFTSGGTTAEIEATQLTAPTIPIPQLLLVPPTSKSTTILVSKDDSSKQVPTELTPKNITDTEGSSMSISDCIPPSLPATTGQPRSVEEATKDAIESTRTPSRPHPKSPNDIISATENALKNQK